MPRRKISPYTVRWPILCRRCGLPVPGHPISQRIPNKRAFRTLAPCKKCKAKEEEQGDTNAK